MTQCRIAPSILSADLARLGDEVNAVLRAGADWIHIDVMDNHYVPNLTFGPMILSALRQHGITAHLDVHLMVEPVDALIEAFAKAGANSICFHPEASQHVHRSLSLIRDHGVMAGLALNPSTPLDILDEVMDCLDLILIMSVNPGFGGQSFIPSALDKIARVRTRIDGSGRDIVLAVDGGVNRDTIAATRHAGADTFIAGSAVFHSDDYAKAIRELRQCIES